MKKEGATVVITHHILADKHLEYEKWLEEIAPICRSAVGFVNWQIIRPVPTLTSSFTIIIRFDSIENIKNWMESQDRKRLIDKIGPLLFKEDSYQIKSGLDFLFSPQAKNAKAPLRWKQYLVTWSAIYPLSLLVPLVLLPLLRMLNMPQNRLTDSLFVSGCIVLLMVYLVMPNYTRWIKTWLYK